MKKLAVFLLSILLGYTTFAQSTQVVRGVVTDKTSEKPLAGISVTIPGTGLGATTDESGRYAGLVYLPVTAENHFTPELPNRRVDLLYLC